MVAEIAHDLPVTNKPAGNDAQSDSEVESAAPATSSSPTLATTKMAARKVFEMSDFFKKRTVTKEDRLAYHRFSWLTNNLLSTIPEVDVPSVHDFLGCELVHFNPNDIAALSCFVMLAGDCTRF
jgi:hypothetical protein